jgi:hypothetical protein
MYFSFADHMDPESSEKQLSMEGFVALSLQMNWFSL